MKLRIRTGLDLNEEVTGNRVSVERSQKSRGVAYLLELSDTQIAFGPGKILAKFCRADSPYVTKDLCKVLLSLKAAGNGHVQYSRIGSTQHRFGTLKPLAQNKLMRGLAR